MALYPEFDPGFLNTWIIVVPAWIVDYTLGLLKSKGFKRAADHSWYTRRDAFQAYSSMILMLLFGVYSIFVSLKVGTPFFYSGIALSAIGLIGKTIGQINFYSAPLDQPITTGVYRISRNPMYFFGSMIMVGAALAAKSGILMITVLLAITATHFVILGEERHLEKQYGDSYLVFKKKVPRYFLFF